ncbi:DJ-1/PfpI family protein [Glycomyces amatae]|uniref:DJ-1/PfpI family protein n=1 Tax=Glycomyces amatae TaxID=2881355 RepID=UPI0034E24F49
MRAQFVLFDGFDPLDVVAPLEVLTAANERLGRLDVALVTAEGPRQVASGTPGVSLTATAALDPTAAYVVVPGASGPAAPEPGADTIPDLLARFASGAAAPLLRRVVDDPAVTVATVCGGSLALAMAGLLAGRRATTNAMGLAMLEAAGARVVRARVVDDGDLVTAGGVTSGLDLALHLLDRDFGPQAALAVEELFEYERRGTAWRRPDGKRAGR